MKKLLLLIIVLLVNFTIKATELESFKIRTSSKLNSSLTCWIRIPKSYKQGDGKQYRIMVLFGGRNWTGDKTIKAYGFGKLADRYRLILLSPSFRDDEYWYPEKWSGKALLQAIAQLKKRYHSSIKKRILYYGYSAGGQCANLFTFWKPEIVKAWGAHACGVWADIRQLDKKNDVRLVNGQIQGLVTCGEWDEQRLQLSRNFIYRAREQGMKIIWRSYSAGHELSKAVLQLAESFFTDILANESKVKYVGDDQAMVFFAVNSSRGKNIEQEYRNEFGSFTTAKLWSVAPTGR